jgi:holo-[acyl-carrier protein] synthase
MIVGLGTDIVDIDRFERAVKRWGDRFVGRILTASERSYCEAKVQSIPSMAVRFAAKEAMIKCLTPEHQPRFRWLDMQVVNTAEGKPTVVLSGALEEMLDRHDIHISLSHSHRSAVAVVILCEK